MKMKLMIFVAALFSTAVVHAGLCVNGDCPAVPNIHATCDCFVKVDGAWKFWKAIRMPGTPLSDPISDADQQCYLDALGKGLQSQTSNCRYD